MDGQSRRELRFGIDIRGKEEMRVSSAIRRIVVLVVAATAVAGVALAILHRTVGHSVAAKSGPTLAAPSLAVKPQTGPSTASQPEPHPDQQQPPASAPTDDASEFALIAAAEVAQLQDGVTLAKWLETQGKTEGWKKTPEEEPRMMGWHRSECLTYSRTDQLPSGAEVTRAVYFYPPPAPSPAVLPKLKGQDLIRQTCVLAIVRIEAEAMSEERGHALDQAARQQLSKQYGETAPAPTATDFFVGQGSVPDRVGAAHWSHGADIFSGYDAAGEYPPNQEPLVMMPLAFVRARLPLVRDAEPQPRVYIDSAAAAHVHQAVVAAGQDAALSQRMEQLYELDTTLAASLEKQVEDMCKTHCLPDDLPKAKNDDWRAPLLPLLQGWFKALNTAQPAQRAAGFYAADRLLVAFSSVRPFGHFGNAGPTVPQDAEKDKLRSDLENLGAKFEPDFADASYYYAASWLDEARHLAPDSEGGRLAELEWMRSAGGCLGHGGSEPFRQIISEGEALLAKKLDPPAAAQVHFMVGDAYADIVGIAGGDAGANGDYDPAIYEGEAKVDRAKALNHYRAGLDVDGSSTEAKAAWSQAWHLAAGMLPNHRYVCFGD